MGKEKGRAFIAMEYLDGVSLSRIIEEGPLESERLLLFATEIADALDAAHSAGIIHRDINERLALCPDPRSVVNTVQLSRVGGRQPSGTEDVLERSALRSKCAQAHKTAICDT
jgi:serine/threonine protein kinase